MKPWKDSLLQAVQTGAQFSKGIPLSSENVVNSFGQIYFSPVVLITDAYCYSACDMFAAGFQDHNIGPILGVDESTGAGGANVLTHKVLLDGWNGGPLQNLPGGASMRVSLRRTLRVGERASQPVEDLGVVRDLPYQMTKDDLLAGNRDLLNRAGEILSTGTPRLFKIQLSTQGPNLKIRATTENVGSIDVYVDGRPTISSATPNGTTEISIPVPPQNAQLSIDGFDNGELVAARVF
jgi:C-terminal processing protease CtpA/Prc